MALNRNLNVSDGGGTKERNSKNTKTVNTKTVSKTASSPVYGSNYGGAAAQNNTNRNLYGSNYNGTKTPVTKTTQKSTQQAQKKTVFDYLKSYGTNNQGAAKTSVGNNLYGSNYYGARADQIDTSNPTGENRYKDSIQAIDKSLGSPMQNLFKTTNKLLNNASDYLEESNQMTDLQKHHLDVTFSGYVDTDPVYSKIKNDRTYASKLADEQGNLIDYTDQITKLEGQIHSTANLNEKKELKQQIDLLKEYQADQKKLQYASYYDYLQKNGASEEDLIAFKRDVIRDNYSGIERTLANFTSTVQSHVGNMVKGYETLYAKASDLFGEEYQMSGYVDKIIDEAETLRQYSMQGAGGMEKLVYEVYDGMAPFLYSLMTAQFMSGNTSYLGNEEAAKALNNRALLMSDVSTLGSKMKQNLDKGYDFDTSFNNAFLSAGLSHITESIGGESLANILTGKIGEELLENTLGYAVKALSNQFLAEATEEGMEAFVEPIIDKYTLNTGLTVEGYIKQVFSKDTAYQMLIGGLGGLTMGSFGTLSTIEDFNSIVDSIQMNSKADYNAAIEARNKLQEIVQKAEQSGSNTETDEAQIHNSKLLISAFNKKINRYAAANPYMDAFVSESDIPKVHLNGDPKSVILDAAAPDMAYKLDEIIQEKNEIGEQSQKALDILQSESDINDNSEPENTKRLDFTEEQIARFNEYGIDPFGKISVETVGDSEKYFDRTQDLDRSQIITDAINNVNRTFGNKDAVATVESNGEQIKLNRQVLKHGILHQTVGTRATAFVTEHIDTAIKNAQKINEIKRTPKHPNGQDVYLSIVMDNNGNAYPTRLLVDKRTTELEEYGIIGRLYAARSYKKEATNRSGETPRPQIASSNLSLNDLVEIVKNNFADTLPQDILNQLGIDKPITDLGENTLLDSESQNDTIENQIHNSMSMQDAKRMLEKAYNSSLKEWYDGKTFVQYLDEVGKETAVEQLSEQILNSPDGDLYFQYVVPIEGIMNEDFTLEDVIEAYFNGDLKNEGGRKRLNDISYEEGSLLENTFYSPKEIEDGRATWDLASQRINDSNREEVLQARADAVIFAHNNQAPEVLGMSQAEINKKVKQWSNYSAKAREISNSLNDGVPREYQWTGLENSNILSRSIVTTDQIREMVKDVYGYSNDYELKDIADAMLAYDGSINYKELMIEFLDSEGARELVKARKAAGTYSSGETKVEIGRKGNGTVYHELGHFIDNLWGRELTNHILGKQHNRYLSELVYDNDSFRNLHFDNENVKKFVSNFKSFIDNLSAKSDIRSDYTMDRKEVFARFCDYFTHWVDKTAGGWGADFSSPYNDNFNVSDCYDFVKLLQQKNALNATALSADSKDVLQTDNNALDSTEDVKLYSIIDDARKDLRSIGEKNRKVNLTETLNKAVTDIRENGDISQDVYNELREKVIESTKAKIPNDAYGLAQDIRDMIGNRFGRLKKDSWDIQLKEINDTYHLYDENEVGINTWQDAQDFLDDYLSSLGGKYIYADPVEMGYMSQEEYDDMVDGKLDEVITNLKDSINNENVVENVADMLTNDDIEENMYRQGQENLDALLNEENELLKRIDDASVGNMTPEQLDAMEQESLQDISIEEAKAQVSPVLKEAAKSKKPLRTMKDILYQVRQKMFDKGIAIRDMKNRQLSVSYDTMLNAENMANYAILNGVYDGKGKKVTEGLAEISKLIPESQKNDFDYYMYHRHNIDAAKIGKPVFMNFDYGKSQQIVNQYEMQYPEWPKVAQKYYDLNDQMLKRQVESGVISQDMADHWKELYPHYVPTKRFMGEVDEANTVETADPQIASSNKGTLYERTGGTSPIQPLDYAMAEHIKQIYKSSLFNDFARDYVKANHSQTSVFNEQQYIEDMVEAREDQVTKADEYTPATMIWYNNGERNIVEIPQNIYDAVKPSETPFNLPSSIPFLAWATKLRTNMITGANPVFWATNAVKDFQDIAFNSKYAKDTYMNLPRAYKQLLTNGEIANLYKSKGGEYQTYSSEAGVNQNEHGKFYNATIGNFVKFNELVEMAPRLAEFMSSLDHGDSVETAMYNAAEVTTNFKRGGDYAKWINRNGVNFFNASIQGFDKQIRNIEDAYDSKGWKGIVSYMAKSSLLSGIPLVVLNGLLHKDDKDYEELSDYIKDNYYILWKYDDGKFVRIPKGRIANAYQGIMSALYKDGVELASDDDALTKAKTIWDNTLDSFANVWEQVGVNDPFSNNIFSPIEQTIKNEAWYGDPIVSTYMQKKDIADQYDESTDLLSVWLGQKTNISPMKINYLIDQYSGGAGDFILPYLTPKAETGLRDGTPIGEVASFFISPYADKFTTDSVFKNQKVSDFFTLDEELTKLAAKEHASDESILASKYINSIQKQMNDLYAQKREIQKDTDLSDAQKYEKARTVQEQINELARTGLDTYDQIDMAPYYGSVAGISYYKKNGEWSKVDAEKEATLNDLGASTQEKSDYFYTVNTIAGIRKDIKDDTPEGEKAEYKEATVNAIETSGLNAKMQNYLYDSYYSGKLTDNVNSMDISDEDKLAIKIASSKGIAAKDANGKTISNSKALSTADAYADAGVLDDVFDYIKQNGLSPSDFGLTKTVYNYSYEGMAKAYQSVFGQQFGTGEATQDEINTINTSYSGKSSGSKSYSSGSKSSSKSKKTKAQIQEEARIKKLKKALLAFLKANRYGSTDLSNALKNSTRLSDVESNVRKVLQNI